jgi:hypothetical protein
MEELSFLLRALKRNDKISQNALFMVAESARYREAEVGRHILNHYRETLNKEPLLDFLSVLCSKDSSYLNYFKAHRAELGSGTHGLFQLLGSEAPEKRRKSDTKENGAKRLKNERIDTRRTREGYVRMPRGAAEPEVEAGQPPGKEHEAREEDVLDSRYLRRAASPSVLYPPNQCKLCGIRYESNEEGDRAMGLHIDEHRRRSRALSEKDCISREFFPTLEAWEKNIEKVKLTLKVDKKEKIRHPGGPSSCEVCKDKIGVEWDDDEDSWVLKDVVALEKGGTTTYCHKKCVT